MTPKSWKVLLIGVTIRFRKSDALSVVKDTQVVSKVLKANPCSIKQNLLANENETHFFYPYLA